MRYKLDSDAKKIVRAIIHGDKARKERRSRGTETEFDLMADNAIEAAGRDMELADYGKETRQYIIDKMYASVRDNIPWEKTGETYCCRRLFYAYRQQYCYRIAMHMGLVNDGYKQVTIKQENKVQ